MINNLSPVLPAVTIRSAQSAARNSTIDLIRTLACFGVVVIHVHSSTAAAESLAVFFLNFCVPFFFATAITYFASSLGPAIDIKSTVTKILKRIGLPFLAWSFIYAALLFVKSSISGKPHSFDLSRVFLYGESAEHIYYLPELLAMQLLALGIYLLTNRIKPAIGLWLVIIPIAYLTCGGWNHYFGITPTKCVIAYLIAGFCLAPSIKSSVKQWYLLLIGIVLFALPLLVSAFKATESPFLNEYLFSLPLSGIGLLLIALNLPNISLPAWVGNITSATYGIYLSHVMLLEAFEFISEKAHLPVTYNLGNKLLVSSMIFIMCAIFVFITRKITLLRPILLGEN